MPVEGGRFDAMEKVAELTFQGNNPTAIAKKLGIQRKDVMALQEDYRIALSQDQQARDLARDYLYQMVKHYDDLIRRFYELTDEIDQLSWSPAAAAQKNASLKAIADLDAKRLEALQKAGLLDSAELGDELAEAEEKREILIDILRNDLCSTCQGNVAHKLSKVTGRVEAMAVEIVNE